MATYQGQSPEKRSKKDVPPSPKKQLTRWQRLVNKYHDDVKLGSQTPFTQTTQGVEDEYAAYTSSRVVQTDILQFWQVFYILNICFELEADYTNQYSGK
jgi:hypothetical protein